MHNLLKWVLWLLVACTPSVALAVNLTPSSSDPSVMYLSYIFGVVNGVLSGSGTQILGKMFGIFNMAVLMLAAVIAVYTTMMAILNTGQDGEFLGKKWSSLFVPVRMLFGVLLIAPTATGYSWIQVGVMWIVLQGVGTANYIWQEAMTYLDNGGSLFVAANAGHSVTFTPQGGVNVQKGVKGHSTAYNTVNGLMPPLAQSVFCLEAMNIALNKLTTNPTYSSHTPAYLAPPTQTPFSTVMASVSSAIPLADAAVIPSTTVNMPNYPTTTTSPSGIVNASDPDIAWSFLNGICGAVTFSGGKPSPTSTGSSAASENVTALGLQQALYVLDGGIYVPTNNVCAITCTGSGSGSGSSTDANCLTAYQYMVMTPSGACAAPTGYLATSVTRTSYANAPFPIFMWNNVANSYDVYSEVFTDATNAFIGLTSTFSGDRSSLDKSSSWMTAGDYFFELMTYVGGTESINGATFSVGSSVGVAADGSPGSLGGTTHDGTAWTNGSGIPTAPAPYLQSCASAMTGCVTYPTALPADTVSYIEGIMLPLVAKDNIKASVYVVGNFLNAQIQDSGGAPMQAASNVGGGNTAASAGFLDIVTGGATGLINQILQLTEINDTNTNPIVVLMQIGNHMINMAFTTYILCTLYSTAIVLGVSFIPSMEVAVSVLTMCMGFFGMIAGMMTPMIAAGAMLLFYFPLIPFMIYTFGVIGWIMGVIEGMVAAPIVGIGIMHPEGHDVFGKGEQALMLLLNMFLRPALMVFGLITSIMMIYISVWLINSGLHNAIHQMWRRSTGFSNLIGQAAIPIVYTTMVINICEKCFTMIHVLPDKVTRWLSGGQQESLGSDMAGVQAQVKQGAQAGVGAIGAAAGKAGEASSGGDSAKGAMKMQEDSGKHKGSDGIHTAG